MRQNQRRLRLRRRRAHPADRRSAYDEHAARAGNRLRPRPWKSVHGNSGRRHHVTVLVLRPDARPVGGKMVHTGRDRRGECAGAWPGHHRVQPPGGHRRRCHPVGDTAHGALHGQAGVFHRQGPQGTVQEVLFHLSGRVPRGSFRRRRGVGWLGFRAPHPGEGRIVRHSSGRHTQP